jgi:pimeloyl-ACP methyl ester carboxylesterase
MFRNLIPMLADKYRVVAPDYPAFGHSAVPSRSDFHYTHAHLSEVVEALIDKLGVRRFAMYVMDFGGPIGYRLILKYPDRVTGIVVQNTPAFGEATEFYKRQAAQHLTIGIRAMEKVADMPMERLHSRKLRNFSETAFQ